MAEPHSTENIRIIDIAERAGVSIGTVDRVLHNRPNVSAKSRKKVEDVLKEINYQPNMFASILASKKKHAYHCLIPQHGDNSYWNEVEKGIEQAIANGSVFKLSLQIHYYNQFDLSSFNECGRSVMENEPDGVVIVPQAENSDSQLYTELEKNGIPYVFLDNDLPDRKAITYYGQDALRSGHFAGHILMSSANPTSEILLMKLIHNGRVASHQQQLRETGFKQYIANHYPNCTITELPLTLSADEDYEMALDTFFSEHLNVRHCITFSSRAYILGEYIQRHGLSGIHLLGYDMLERNVASLQNSGIEFIIAQHPWRQGYGCIRSLTEHLIMKHAVERYNYIPLELLTAENHHFYSYDENRHDI